MGGPPQHSTWDPKPDAPAEVRGEFGPIATNVPGLSLCELLPMTALVADKLCVLAGGLDGRQRPLVERLLHAHGPAPPADELRERQPRRRPTTPRASGPCSAGSRAGRGGLPPSVTLPHRIFNTDGSVWPGQDAGLLGRAADPWLLNARLTPEGYRIQEIDLPADLDPARLERPDGPARPAPARARRPRPRPDGGASSTARPGGRSTCSGRRPHAGPSGSRTSPRRSATATARSPFGQGVLLARRLVEAGVRLVQVNWYRGADEPPANPCWDSHTEEAARLKDVLAPPTDRAFSALLEDLDRRGLLDETLVVCMAEFGRTPRLDANGGRDHWGSVFSVALAGGGIRGGQVYGSSDKIGGLPPRRPGPARRPLGHDLPLPGPRPETEYLDPLGRPHPISRGEVLRAIL